MEDSINLKKLSVWLENEFLISRELLDKTVRQASSASDVTPELEEQANCLHGRLLQLGARMREARMVCDLFFFQPAVFAEEGVSEEDVRRALQVVAEYYEKTGQLAEQLERFMGELAEVLRERHVRQREERLKKQKANSRDEAAEAEVKLANDWFLDEMLQTTKELKKAQQAAKDELLGGKDEIEQMEKDTKENVVEVKKASTTVKNATKAIKANNPTFQIIGAAIEFAVLLVLVIVL